jgi:hypothetical protein
MQMLFIRVCHESCIPTFLVLMTVKYQMGIADYGASHFRPLLRHLS